MLNHSIGGAEDQLLARLPYAKGAAYNDRLWDMKICVYQKQEYPCVDRLWNGLKIRTVNAFFGSAVWRELVNPRFHAQWHGT